jgi:hypothetical protein
MKEKRANLVTDQATGKGANMVSDQVEPLTIISMLLPAYPQSSVA